MAHLVWWPQRDKTPNGIPAEFVIELDRDRAPAKPRGGKHPDGDGRERS
jgi:hypothetical protein